MAKTPSRFKTDDLIEELEAGVPHSPPGPTVPAEHKPMVLRKVTERTVDSRIAELERQLAERSAENGKLSARAAELHAEIGRLRALAPASDQEELLLLNPDVIVDRLPRDRSGTDGFEDDEFEKLVTDISANGQNDAITVRRADDGGFEIAAGRRRLAACRRLGIEVLARGRQLDRHAMLRVQFSENERRANVSALDRAMWFAEVKNEFKGTMAKKIAADFGISEPMLSHYLKISRFPDQVRSRLKDVRKVSVAVARQVVEAIDSDGDAGFAKVLAALDGAPEEIDADAQVNLIIRATTKTERKASAPKPRSEHFVIGGRR